MKPFERPDSVKSIVPIRPQGSRRQEHNLLRLVETANGERLLVFPGVRNEEIHGLLPHKWEGNEDIVNPSQSSRGVFFRHTNASDGRKFDIAVKPLRRRASYTHEARMLMYLRKNGVPAEQPLALLLRDVNPDSEGRLYDRFLITRRLKFGNTPIFGLPLPDGRQYKEYELQLEKVTGGKTTRQRLRELGIESDDFKGLATVPAYLKGAVVDFVVDAEHLHSEREKKLSIDRIAKVVK